MNQHGREVLAWARWVMVAKRDRGAGAPLDRDPAARRARSRPRSFACPRFLDARPRSTPTSTGGTRLWDDYAPGEVIDHPGGMTIEESDHMLATRLYQNTARIHFDALLAQVATQFGKRLVYGGHVISVCRALSYDGLENAFAIAAIHGGTHANPTFAGDTLYCRHVVLGARGDSRAPRRGRAAPAHARREEPSPSRDLPPLAPGEKHAAVVLDLDYSVLIPAPQSP